MMVSTDLDEETAVAMDAAGEQGARQWIQLWRWVSRLYSLFAVDHNFNSPFHLFILVGDAADQVSSIFLFEAQQRRRKGGGQGQEWGEGGGVNGSFNFFSLVDFPMISFDLFFCLFEF